MKLAVGKKEYIVYIEREYGEVCGDFLFCFSFLVTPDLPKTFGLLHLSFFDYATDIFLFCSLGLIIIKRARPVDSSVFVLKCLFCARQGRC